MQLLGYVYLCIYYIHNNTYPKSFLPPWYPAWPLTNKCKTKRILSLSTLKRILQKKKKPKEEIITVTLIDNSINEDPQELQDSQWLLPRKLTFFGFLLMVYDRVGDGGKIFKGKFWLWKSWFSCYQSLKNWS